MKKFTDIFVQRPVFTICINLILLLAGIQAINSLTTRQYPKSDLAVVTITTAYVGASANLVKGFVTTPLERVIASADGIDYLESSSAQGLSTINAHLKLNYDVNAALSQIQSKVNQVRNDLPPEAEVPTINVETSDNRFASIYLSFYSETLESNQITDYLIRVVQPKLSSIAGVQKADILGGRTFAMRVWLKPDRMAAMGISPRDVYTALDQNNALSAPGSTRGQMVSVNLSANTDLSSAEEFKQLVVKQKEGTLIRLEDIADVVLGAENYDNDVRFDGKQATFIGIWALPNANSLEVVQRVRAVLPEIEAGLPKGLSLGIPYDATEYIQNAIDEVLHALIETVLIVILVIFFFIGSVRSVLVPVIAIPLSLLGGAALMYVFGFSLNLLTLLAIVLAVGLVVDDAIVMLENVERHVEEGMRPFDAAIRSARELFGPIVAMTITLAAVYAPIGFQGGLTGVLFREFAFTLAGAVVVSGIVALTLSPMMASKLVRHNGETSLKKRVDSVFDSIQTRYEGLLRKSLSVRPAIIAGCLVLVLGIPPLYMMSIKELAPKEDQGFLFGIVQAAPNSTIDQTLLYIDLVGDAFTSMPEYATSFQVTMPSSGFSGIITKPWEERSRTTLEMEPELWGKVAQIPGVRTIVTSPPPLPGGSDFPVELVLTSTDDPKDMLPIAQQLVAAAFQSGKFMFADTDLKYDLPEAEIDIDRNKVAALGLDLKQVANEIAVLTGGNYVNRFSIQGRSYKVIPQLKRKDRLNPEQLEDVFISGPEGSLIPLSSVARITRTVTPRQLNRFQQLNSVKVQGALPPGISIDQGLSVIEQKAKELLPVGYQIDYAGQSRQLRKEGNALIVTLFMALILIYLVLGAQFESFRDPFIILIGSVPLALSGALIFPFLGFTTMNIYSQVGLITLVGLVAKNGILIVEFANELQEQGRSRMDAAIGASLSRLRPILMTSVATIAGHSPLIFASGAGAGARNSIGITLVSGMCIGTIFTLFVVPAVYSVIARNHSNDTQESDNDSTHTDSYDDAHQDRLHSTQGDIAHV